MRGFGVFCACLLLGGVARASGCHPPVALRFAPGASAAVLEGAIPRGQRDCFTITARAGQRLSVSQPGRAETNIVLQLFAPHWRVLRGPAIGGRTLPDAGDAEDAESWAGRLPVGGTYLLVLGTTWGGGAYRVLVSVR